MIEGVVNANMEAVVTLTLRGETGQEREIEAVIDTGFNGFLTLPPTLAVELGLPFASIGLATLADGSEAARCLRCHRAVGRTGEIRRERRSWR